MYKHSILSRNLIETGLFPLLSAYKDNWKLAVPSRKIALRPEFKRPIEEYLIYQGRFKHLFNPEKNIELISQIQNFVDEKWERIKAKANNV